MTPSLLLTVLASGFIYGITPRSGVLAVFGIGAQRVRTVYQRHEILITKLCGVMFVGFAINALAQALPGLFGSKPA